MSVYPGSPIREGREKPSAGTAPGKTDNSLGDVFSKFGTAYEQYLFLKFGTVAGSLVSHSCAIIIDCGNRISQEFGYTVTVGDTESYQSENA